MGAEVWPALGDPVSCWLGGLCFLLFAEGSRWRFKPWGQRGPDPLRKQEGHQRSTGCVQREAGVCWVRASPTDHGADSGTGTSASTRDWGRVGTRDGGG